LDNLKPRLKNGIFKGISWLRASSFGGDGQGFLKEQAKIYVMASISPLDSPLT
jgi:hypothetical protein